MENSNSVSIYINFSLKNTSKFHMSWKNKSLHEVTARSFCFAKYSFPNAQFSLYNVNMLTCWIVGLLK